MTFFLKGNARELRFTDETRSLGHEGAPESVAEDRPSGAALGKPRTRRAALPALAPTRAPARPSPPTIDPAYDLRGDESLETALYHRPASRTPAQALAPDAFVPRAPPIPHFRARALDELRSPRPGAEQWNAKTVLVPRARPAPRLPLVVWLAAALVAGALSFRFVPELVARGDASSITPPR